MIFQHIILLIRINTLSSVSWHSDLTPVAIYENVYFLSYYFVFYRKLSGIYTQLRSALYRPMMQQINFTRGTPKATRTSPESQPATQTSGHTYRKPSVSKYLDTFLIFKVTGTDKLTAHRWGFCNWYLGACVSINMFAMMRFLNNLWNFFPYTDVVISTFSWGAYWSEHTDRNVEL